METLIIGLVATAWAAILAIMLWALVANLRRAMAAEGPLPLFAMLDRHRLTLTQVVEAVGIRGLGEAARRCAMCADVDNCRRRPPADCPNAHIIRRANAQEVRPC